MAEDRDVVRVTYKDLEQIAQRNKIKSPDYTKEAGNSSTRDSHASKKSKRPERSIYRPGLSRLRKTSESQEDTGSKNIMPTDSISNDSRGSCNQLCQDVNDLNLQENNCDDVEEAQKMLKENKPRRKRPDIQIYVPRGKLLEKDEDQSPESAPQYADEEDLHVSTDEPLASEDEHLQGRNSRPRKVNIAMAKEKKMSITVVNSEIQVKTPTEENEKETGYFKTMIFKRSGSDFASTNNPKGDYRYLKNVDCFENKVFQSKDEYDIPPSKDSNGTFFTSSKSYNSIKTLTAENRDISSKPPISGQNSPSGKSRRYSLAKRKQRNGKRENDNNNSREDLAKDSAASNSELDSDTALDELENMTPIVLDWSEEVEREIGEDEGDISENIKEMQSDLIQVKPTCNLQQKNTKQKSTENRQRKLENVQDRHDRVASKKTNQDSKIHGTNRPQRRSSFDSAAWSNEDQSRSYHVDHSDAESDITDHRKKRSGRKRERKRTRSGPGVGNPNDGLGLRVTIDRNERQVEVKDEREQRRRPPEYHSSRERLSSDSDFIHSPKGGGILHLSQNLDNQLCRAERHRRNSGPRLSNENSQPRTDNRGGPRISRDNVRGTSGGQRTLFDPSNPSKPIIIQSASQKLKFTDSKPSPPLKPAPYDTYNPSSYPGGFFPGYGRGYPASQFAPSYGTGEQVYYGYPGAFQESSSCGDDAYAKDPYYHSGNDTDYVIGGMSRSQCRAMADHILRDASPLDSQLLNILSRRLHRDGEQLLKTLRHDLKTKYEQVILLDPDLANKHNVEQLLWKNVFYQVIEIYRRHLVESHEEETTVDLLQLLDEASLFYESLLEKLQHTYGFHLEQFLEGHPPPDNLSRAVKLALLSSQRTMICLGDIARYREQAHGKMNYGKARSWYMKAQQIAPKNGRPYNQLAILALYTKRKLDAVYYYMRSLAASNPFLTARESLMSLFDEARKKAEATEAKKLEEREKLKTWRKRRQKEGPRIEIWVSADGRSEMGEVEENYEEDLSHMTPVELNKRLSLSFLNSHGKLFTKIGMETFDDVCGQLLQEYKYVLCRHPVIIANNRLLQLMAMNMFAVDNTALRGERMEDNCRSLLQENAVQQGLDMFGVLVSRFTCLLRAHVETKDYPSKLFSDDLHELVASIKVWSDWMLCHPTLWNPAPNLKDPDCSFKIDIWKEAADMFNVLKEVDITHVKLYRDKKEGCDAVILEEDACLAGFVPLLSAPSEPMFVHTTVEKHVAKDCLRIQKLQRFGDYLCGIEPPMLAYNVETRKYYSVAPSVDYTSDDSHGKGNNSEEDDVIIESEVSEEGSEVEEPHKNGLQELRAKKEHLQRKLDEQTKQKENVQAILEKHRHRAMELEICPVFLIPDTNCFINYMAGMQKLLRSKKFTLVVPLVVINELDGLTKGGSGGHPNDVAHHQHATRVSNHAKQAVQLLESEFGKRNPHLKALTSKGSTLETISFRSEEADNTGINDDLILSCCLHYCKDRAKDFMPKTKDTPIRLRRDVVLLTDDRNLRLKAHTRNVPVKDIPSFLKWAKIT